MESKAADKSSSTNRDAFPLVWVRLGWVFYGSGDPTEEEWAINFPKGPLEKLNCSGGLPLSTTTASPHQTGTVEGLDVAHGL